MAKCRKCSHEWRTRIDTAPKSCPRCGSARWNAVLVSECPICKTCPVHNPVRGGYEDPGLYDAAGNPIPERTPEEAAALARFNELPDDPDKCCCRGAHRPENPNCEANYPTEAAFLEAVKKS